MTAAVIHLDRWEHPCALCGEPTPVEHSNRKDAYDARVCEECFSAVESEAHRTGCVCRYCLARRAAFTARLRLAARRKREAEHEHLRAIGAVVVGPDGKEDISW